MMLRQRFCGCRSDLSRLRALAGWRALSRRSRWSMLLDITLASINVIGVNHAMRIMNWSA
jgi:hypothetical protein